MAADPVDLHCTLIAQRYDPETAEWTVGLDLNLELIDQVATIKSPFSTVEEADLTWYVEKHALSDPFARRRAKRVCQNLHRYKKTLGATIEPLLEKALAQCDAKVSLRSIRLCIEDNIGDASLQSLHWELLEDEHVWKVLQIPVLISRLVGASEETGRKDVILPKAYNILFVAARPTQRDDLPYRLISKPVWTLIQSYPDLKDGISMQFVRPGTWDKTIATLNDYNKGHFSLVHFDLHGIIHTGRAGLCFSPSSTHHHRKVFVDASKIAALLAERGVNTVVLNACESAKVSSSELSNLAHVFNIHGVRNVVAMSYGLTSHGASIFMNAFYSCFLLKRYDLQRAVFMARLQLRTDRNRLARYTTSVEVKDDFVPTLYQTHRDLVYWREAEASDPDDIGLSSPSMMLASELPENTQNILSTVVGRDMDMLLLEAVMEDFKVINLIGDPGVGKTTFIRYLQDWWTSSGFAERTFYFDCQKDPDLWNDSVIYDRIEKEISDKIMDHDNRKTAIHKAHYIIFLDNVEPVLAQNPGFPGNLSPDQKRRFIAFIREFEKSEDYRCKLVFSSRKAPEMDSTLKIQAVVLKPVSIVEAMANALVVLASHGVSTDLSEEASQQLEDIILFHDNNFLFIDLIIPALKDERNKLDLYLSDLQLGLPPGISKRIDDNLATTLEFEPDCPEDQPSLIILEPNIMFSFAFWVLNLEERFPRRYWILMSLAPFQKLVPLDPKVLLVLLHIRGFISDGDFEPLESEIQQTKLLQYYSQEGIEKFFAANPDWITDYSLVCEQLEAHGLVKIHFHSNPRQPVYMELHPLLPYLIRHQLMYRPAGDGHAILDQTYSIFREYYELRTRALLFIDPQIDIIMEVTAKERINLHSAINLTLEHPQFGCEMMMVLNTPTNDNIAAATPKEQRMVAKIMLKILERFRQLVASENGFSTTSDTLLSNRLLEQTMSVAIYRSLVLGCMRDNAEAISNANIALEIYEKATVSRLIPTDNVLSQKTTLECVAVQKDWSPERVEVLLNTEAPENAEFAYKAQLESHKQTLRLNYTYLQAFGYVHQDQTKVFKELKTDFPLPENAILAAFGATPGVKENIGDTSSVVPKLIDLFSKRGNLTDEVDLRSLVENLSDILTLSADAIPDLRSELDRLSVLANHTTETMAQRRDKMQKAAAAAHHQRNYKQEYVCCQTLFSLAVEDGDHDAAVLHQQRLGEMETRPQLYNVGQTADSLDRTIALRNRKLETLAQDAASSVKDPVVGKVKSA